MNFQRKQNLLTDSPSSSSEADPVVVLQLCSPCLRLPATDCNAQPVHAEGRRLRKRPAGPLNAEPDLLGVVFALTLSPVVHAKNVMFCSSYVLHASLILKITMALVEPWVVLIWVACFVFLLLPFPVSPSLSLFWEPTRWKPQVPPRDVALPAAGKKPAQSGLLTHSGPSLFSDVAADVNEAQCSRLSLMQGGTNVSRADGCDARCKTFGPICSFCLSQCPLKIHLVAYYRRFLHQFETDFNNKKKKNPVMRNKF